jgi:hypothetical protein
MNRHSLFKITGVNYVVILLHNYKTKILYAISVKI